VKANLLRHGAVIARDLKYISTKVPAAGVASRQIAMAFSVRSDASSTGISTSLSLASTWRLARASPLSTP
jgi:hypothetical protein